MLVVVAGVNFLLIILILLKHVGVLINSLWSVWGRAARWRGEGGVRVCQSLSMLSKYSMSV